MSNSKLKKIGIQYFAILREERGCEKEIITTSASTPIQLYNELQSQHGFTLPFKHMRVAINAEFQNEDFPIKEGDQVVFIPPVAGG